MGSALSVPKTLLSVPAKKPAILRLSLIKSVVSAPTAMEEPWRFLTGRLSAALWRVGHVHQRFIHTGKRQIPTASAYSIAIHN